MPSTYTVNLGIQKPATGEQSGTWGNTTNANFDILDQGINGAIRLTLTSAGSSGSPNALAINEGTVSDGHNKWIEFYSSGDLGGNVFVQLTPNDAEKIVFVRNSLAGSRSVLLFQGTYNSGRDLEIPAGVDMVVKFSGGGASAATVTDVYTKLRATEITTPSLTATTADINGGTIDNSVIGGSTAAAVTGTAIVANTSLNIAGDGATVTGIKDEDNMASNSATKLATQQSIKTYVDTQVATIPVGDITSVVAGSGLTGGGTTGDVTLNVIGGTGITANANDITIDATVATLTGTQTFTNKTLTSAVLNTSVSGTAVLDEDNMASNSATKLATQQSIKSYVDTQVATIPTGDITGVTAGTGLNGGGTSGTVTVNIDAKIAPATATELGSSIDLNDLNALSDAGFYYQSSNSDTTGNNYPSNEAGSLLIQKSAAGVTQLYQTYDTSTTELFFRSYYSSTWGSWNKVWTDGNDGAGSGLSADTLDGVSSTQFLRSDTSDTFTGTLTMAGQLQMNGNIINDVEDIYLRDRMYHDGDTDTYFQFSTNIMNFNTGGTNRLQINDSQVTASGEFQALRLRATSTGDASLTSTAHGLQVGPTTSSNLAIDGNEILARNNGAASSLILQNDGGNLSACAGGGTATFGGQLQMGGNDIDNVANIYLGNVIYHHGDTNTYLQFHAADSFQIVCGGAQKMITTTTNTTFTTDITVADQIIHEGDTNTYMQFHAADQWRVVTGGNERLEVNNSAVTVAGVLSVGTAIDLADNKILRFGSGDDVEFFFNGADMYTDLNAGAWFIRDGTTNRFLFNDNGDFHADANIFAYSTSVGSDRKLKDNIELIESPLEKIQKLNGVTFNWKRDGEASAGVIAQDVQKVLPSAVKEVKQLSNEGEDATRLNVDYNQIIGLLVESVKELKKEIEELKKGK